ncbi:MAG: Hsp70 family protein [Desulfosudaceae bacterium]
MDYFNLVPMINTDQPPLELVRTLAIDLGTTNLVAAESVWVPGFPPRCRVLKLEQPLETGTCRQELVPAELVVRSGTTVEVGEGARRRRGLSGNALTVEKNLFFATKNDMGLQKRYFQAPAELDRPWKVAGYLLGFMAQAAGDQIGGAFQAVTVTVPASFQLNQRRDTLRAARLADLHLADDDLLDEPTAALIDYLMAPAGSERLPESGEAIWAVIDFGGGTCDVTVAGVSRGADNERPCLSQLSVSRYHRLGGGDIDAAIVHEVLIPDLLAANDLDPLDLTWADKKKVLEPRLLATAEKLKISLCREMARHLDRGPEFSVTTDAVTCRVGSRKLRLPRPSLSIRRFAEILEPFLDRDFLYARETEYRLTQSLFSPVEDALDRAGIAPEEVDFCLLTGGSGLIPQVRRALDAYFGKENVVGGYTDVRAMQVAVARGAAWHAIVKTITGHPLVQPVLHDGIALETSDGGHFPLVPSRVPLPWPADGSYRQAVFEVPRTGDLFVTELRLDLVGLSDGRPIFGECWTLPRAACQGDEIILEYRLTAGKQLDCRAFLAEAPEEELTMTVENPLVNVVNPGSTRLNIETVEARLSHKNGGGREDREDFIQLAEWYARLNQQEKSLHYLRTALKKLGRPDFTILNLQGIYYTELGDSDRAEKAYLEADRVSAPSNATALFNLALNYRDNGRLEEALDLLRRAMEKDCQTGPYLTLTAQVLDRLDRPEEAADTGDRALRSFAEVSCLDAWELGWYITAARFRGEDKRLEEGRAEQRRRKQPKKEASSSDAPRPAVRQALMKVSGADAKG